MERLRINNYNYDSIKYFISVASHSSLSKAAYSLGISQSALSQSMKNLEDSLGIALFNRNTRGIILTPEGKAFYERAKIGNVYFENAIIELLRMNKFDTERTFKISSSRYLLSLFINPVMKKIIEKYPKINFEITSVTTESNVVEKLMKGEIDLAILKTYDNFLVKEIETCKLQRFTYCFVYNPKYFNIAPGSTYEELKKYTIIIKKRTGKNDNSWIKTTFEHLLICGSDKNILELIKLGIGIGMYPKELAEKEGLKVLEIEELPETTREVTACYLRSNDVANNIVKIITDNIV